MSASLDNPTPSTSDPPVLTPKLPPHWALGSSHLAVTAFWAVVFLFFSYLPLRATDLWGHTLWGHWILEHQRLPVEDPFFPLAAGMEVIDSAWLSQVTFAAVDRQFGPEGLAALFTILSVGSLLLLGMSFYQLSGRQVPTVAASLIVIIVGWSRATTLRPENFGVLCFAALIWLLTWQGRDVLGVDQPPARRNAPWLLWLAVPAIFCLWANFHGSYLVGLILLGCIAAGKLIGVTWSQRSLRMALADAGVQQAAFMTELGLLASLINPYGIRLLIYNLTFAGNPNLAAILEWQPLVILGIGGRAFALSIVLLLALWRLSRARVSPAQAILLAVFGYLAIKSVRMLGWYAPVYAWVITPHLADLWGRVRPLPAVPPEPVSLRGTDYKLLPGRSFHYTLVCGLLVWLAFSFSPFGNVLLGGKGRKPEQLYDHVTSPLDLAEQLAKHPPQGRVFHPQHWGDWLIRRLDHFEPFVTSNIHLAPRQVWEDYQRISAAQPGWQRVLDRYNVTTVIVDTKAQPVLAQAMTQAQNFRRTYDDDQAVVYVRRKDESPTADAAATITDERIGGEEPETSASEP